MTFLGPEDWGQYTFFNPLGPIAMTVEAVKKEPAEALDLSQLNLRLNSLIAAIQPSLENNKNENLTSPVKDYFDRVRNCLVYVAKLYSLLGHLNPQLCSIDDGMVRTRTAVTSAENKVREMTAVLPNVRLPTSTASRLHTEWAGSDGIIHVAIKEAASGVSVDRTWTGGDGSMTETDVNTIIPYKDIGSVELAPPPRSGDKAWTLRVQSSNAFFAETWSSPECKTPRRVLRAVNFRTTQHFLYLAFSSAPDAQDAYTARS